MKVKVEIFNDGTIACETQIDTRHYRSRYRGYTLLKAKQKFVKRVTEAEQAELDRVRMEAIYMCLHCTRAAGECKGDCKYKPKDGKKIFRKKGVI